MALLLETDDSEMGLAIEGFSLPKRGPRGISLLEESQDCGLVTEHDEHLLVVLADGTSHAHCGVMSARWAVEAIRVRFAEGEVDAESLLSSACKYVHLLNADNTDAASGAKSAYQCTCTVVVVDRSGRFTWASVGNVVVIVTGDDNVERLTVEAEALAARDLHPVGLPLETIRICHGEAWIQPGQKLFVHTDGFQECWQDCQGMSVLQMERVLKRRVLNDDVTFVQIVPHRRIVVSTASHYDEIESMLVSEKRRQR